MSIGVLSFWINSGGRGCNYAARRKVLDYKETIFNLLEQHVIEWRWFRKCSSERLVVRSSVFVRNESQLVTVRNLRHFRHRFAEPDHLKLRLEGRTISSP